MNFMRRMALAMLGSLLFLALLGTAWGHVVNSTIGNRAAVKSWLNESGFYGKVVPAVLESANKETQESGSGQTIPVNDPEVQKIASQAFSPEFLQTNVEKVLDGTYAWLEGETDTPEFEIDLEDAKQRLADGIGNYASAKAAKLPACTPAQAAEMSNNGGFDVLSATCLPPGVDGAAAAAELRNQIVSSEDFLEDTKINGDDIKVTGDGQEVPLNQAAELKRLQSGYKLGSMLPVILAVLAILAAVGIVFLSQTRLKGLGRAGWMAFIAGITLGISWFVVSRGTSWLNERAADWGGTSDLAQDLAVDMVSAVSNDITSLLKWYALGLILLGIALFVVSKVVARNKKPEADKSSEPETSNDKVEEAPKETTSKPESKPEAKPETDKKPPRKVQL